MTTAIQYLETAKIEEVAEKLRGEGYQVTVSPTGESEPMKNYFPFTFDVQLDLHRKISRVYKIEVDTSSLDE